MNNQTLYSFVIIKTYNIAILIELTILTQNIKSI